MSVYSNLLMGCWNEIMEKRWLNPFFVIWFLFSKFQRGIKTKVFMILQVFIPIILFRIVYFISPPFFCFSNHFFAQSLAWVSWNQPGTMVKKEKENPPSLSNTIPWRLSYKLRSYCNCNSIWDQQQKYRIKPRDVQNDLWKKENSTRGENNAKKERSL